MEVVSESVTFELFLKKAEFRCQRLADAHNSDQPLSEGDQKTDYRNCGTESGHGRRGVEHNNPVIARIMFPHLGCGRLPHI
jgi:hypothetical protein